MFVNFLKKLTLLISKLENTLFGTNDFAINVDLATSFYGGLYKKFINYKVDKNDFDFYVIAPITIFVLYIIYSSQIHNFVMYYLVIQQIAQTGADYVTPFYLNSEDFYVSNLSSSEFPNFYNHFIVMNFYSSVHVTLIFLVRVMSALNFLGDLGGFTTVMILIITLSIFSINQTTLTERSNLMFYSKGSLPVTCINNLLLIDWSEAHQEAQFGDSNQIIYENTVRVHELPSLFMLHLAYVIKEIQKKDAYIKLKTEICTNYHKSSYILSEIDETDSNLWEDLSNLDITDLDMNNKNCL